MEKLTTRLEHRYIIISIGMISLLFFIPFLGSSHLFDWDEINFAEIAREMIVTGDYTTVKVNFQQFWEKPPLFMWFQAGAMQMFGINEFAARLPNAIAGVAALIILYLIGRHLYNKLFGILWALVYFGSFLPHFYFKSGIIDPIFNLWMFLGVYFLFKSYQSQQNKYRQISYAGLFIGLAVLTKGPVGYLLPILTWLFLWGCYFKKFRFPFRSLAIVTGISFLISLGWYGIDLWQHGLGFLKAFTTYQFRLLTTTDAGHGGPFYYHFIVLLIGCFPASIFIFPALQKQTQDNPKQHQFKNWMILLLIVVLVVFSMVQTKIIHYSSLAYYPITFLSAYYIYHLTKGHAKWKNYLTIIGVFIGMLLAIAFILLPIIGKNLVLITPYIKDPFAKANLQANVVWNYYEVWIGTFYLITIISSFVFFHKKRLKASILLLFGGTAITLFLGLTCFAPKIEQYTQNAPISFYKSLQNKDVYIKVLGYKSYAHLFYGRVKEENAPNNTPKPSDQSFKKWLLTGEIDKPAYFVCKIIDAQKYRKREQLKEIQSKNGFVFFKRSKSNN